MKILVNTIPTLTPLTGVGQYTYQLTKELRRLAPDEEWSSYYGFVTRQFFRKPEDSGASGGVLLAAGRTLRAIAPVKTAVRYFHKRLASLRPGEFDLYFEPNFVPLPELKSKKCVVTIHDFSFLHHPEWHPAERIQYFEKHFLTNLSRADRILTDSAFVRDEAVGKFGLDPDKVRVVHAGCDHGLFAPQPEEAVLQVRDKYSLGRPYFLYVGTIEPRKNLLQLLEVFERFSTGQHGEPQLVLCGHQGWSNHEVLRQFERLSQREVIRFLGHVPSADLPPLYSGAIALAYPSLYEGFGLPVVEAMACGCPTLCSRTASLPEVGGEAPVYVDPGEGESILQGLRRLQEEPALRQRCREVGLAQAQKFSWEKTAREVLSHFSEVTCAAGRKP